MVDTLVENIASWKDVGCFQNESVYAGALAPVGCIVAKWSVAGQMNIEGVTALAIGTYYINVADDRNAVDSTGDGTQMATRRISLPDNAILTQVPIIDVHEAFITAGTLNVNVGAVKLTADAALTTAGTYIDDGTGNVFVAGRKSAAEEAISVVTTVGTLTAGAFTLWIPYVQGL